MVEVEALTAKTRVDFILERLCKKSFVKDERKILSEWYEFGNVCRSTT